MATDLTGMALSEHVYCRDEENDQVLKLGDIRSGLMLKNIDRRARRGVVVSLLLMALSTAAAVASRPMLISKAFAESGLPKSIEVDRSTYFRLKMKLAYKGEPQDFDIVVGCNVRQTNYVDNSRTVEVGLVPTVLGRRMSDGKGLVVRAPRACRGETTANGLVPQDLLPAVIVYDDAGTLNFGTAYLSEDAYEAPSSLLKFGGATIESATQGEFEAFRRAQPNLVTRESYHSALAGDEVLKRMGLSRVAPAWAHRCEGYRRYRIPDELRPLVRQHWLEGNPEYWQAKDWQEENQLLAAIFDGKSLRSDRDTDTPRSLDQLGPVPSDPADFGFPTRAGGGVLHAGASARRTRFPPAYYPAASDYRLDRWPQSRADWPGYVAAQDKFAGVDIDRRGGAMRGFAYCFTRNVSPQDEAWLAALRKGVVGRVDGRDVASSRRAGNAASTPALIFERDEYLLRFFDITLESTRGDV
jgi:hypothetical protein